MKSFKYLLHLLILTYSFNLKAQNYHWANSGGTIWNDGAGICKDSYGDLFLSGGLYDGPTGTSGNAIFENDTIQINGCGDIFASKINSFGSFEYTKSFGSIINIQINETGTLFYEKSSTNMYLLSLCRDGQVYFDSIYFQNSGTFFGRMSLDGKFIWVKKLMFEYGDITFDNHGKIYLIGENKITKMDSLGNILWSKQISSTSVFLYSRVYFYNDSLIITGGGLNNCPFDTSVLNSPLTNYMFISLFDSSGNFSRATIIRSSNPVIDYSSKLNNGKLVQSFRYTDSITIDNLSFYSFGNAAVICLFDINGHFLWHKRIDYTGELKIQCTEFTDGSIYITGWFDDQFTYDSTRTFIAASSPSCFVLSINENGNILDGFIIPKSEGTGIVRADDGSVVLAGTFTDTLFLGNTRLISHGHEDIFITKMDSLNTIFEPQRRKQETLEIYANPNTGSCRVVLPEGITSVDKLNLIITDGAGRIIFNGKPNEIGNEIVVNLENEASGKYFVQLSNGKKTYRGTIIFER